MWRPDCREWRIVARGIRGANGLALAKGTRGEDKLLVASAGTGRMLEFDRDPATGMLGQYIAHTLPTGSAPDNLKLTSDGRLLATGTPCRVDTALYLLFQNCFGAALWTSPVGHVWAWTPSNGYQGPGSKLFTWPASFVGPSTTVRLGDWWLGSQMVDDRVAYRPVAEP